MGRCGACPAEWGRSFAKGELTEFSTKTRGEGERLLPTGLKKINLLL